MPLVNPSAGAPPVEKPAPVRITAPTYRGVTVDTRYIPASSLLTHVEGSAWSVNYYSQVLDADSDVTGQNLDLSPIYQQYSLIKGLELKVTSPLTTSQDNESGQMVMNGSANVYPFLIPNVGDMFLADIGDGREGVFKVTNSERRAVFKDTCYVIEYQFVDYSTAERLNDFISKTVVKYQFVRDFLQYGQNPLLHEEDFEVLRQLEMRYSHVVATYFKAFFSNEFQTLILPGQTQAIYDHFLTKAVTAMLPIGTAPELLKIRRLNVDDDQVMGCTQFWDILAQKDKKLFPFAAKRAGLLSAKGFSRNPMLESIYYSGIGSVVYPIDPVLTVDYTRLHLERPVSGVALMDVPSPIIDLEALIPAEDLATLPYSDAPFLTKVTADDYYVFSEAFYTDAPTGQSRLELCVHDYLDNKALDHRLLLALCDTSYAWGGLERFYFIPILLMLIKATVRGI